MKNLPKQLLMPGGFVFDVVVDAVPLPLINTERQMIRLPQGLLAVQQHFALFEVAFGVILDALWKDLRARYLSHYQFREAVITETYRLVARNGLFDGINGEDVQAMLVTMYETQQKMSA